MTGAASSDSGIRLLIVDDHRIFAEVLAMRLSSQPGVTVVETAFSLAGACALIHGFRPDFVYLDYKLADESGLDLLAHTKKASTPPFVLIVSAVTDHKCVVSALHAGVHGWVAKDASIDVLIRATSEVRQGQIFLSPGLLTPVVRQLLRDTQGGARPPSFLDELTQRETEVLDCLVAGMSRAEVAERLFLSVNTVRTHVQHLLRRSGEHSTLALVASARRLGVRGIDPPPQDIPSQRTSSI